MKASAGGVPKRAIDICGTNRRVSAPIPVSAAQPFTERRRRSRRGLAATPTQSWRTGPLGGKCPRPRNSRSNGACLTLFSRSPNSMKSASSTLPTKRRVKCKSSGMTHWALGNRWNMRPSASTTSRGIAIATNNLGKAASTSRLSSIGCYWHSISRGRHEPEVRYWPVLPNCEDPHTYSARKDQLQHR